MRPAERVVIGLPGGLALAGDDRVHTSAEAFAEEAGEARLRRSLERGMAFALVVRENVHIGT